jgi:hypothetical protein
MLCFIIDRTTEKPGIKPDLKLTVILLILLLCPLISVSQENESFVDPSEGKPANSAITYRNPVEYDLEYIFELYPDLNKIDKRNDLKLWIPLDPTAGMFGYLYGLKMIHGKGRDIKIGPEAPQEGPYGYGSQWKLIHDGRVDFPLYGVYNIGKIQTAKVKIVHYPDETTDKALID